MKKGIVKITLHFVLFLFLSADGESRQKEENQPPETIEELRSAILQVLEETGTPAAGIAIVDSTGPVWIESLGKADVAQNLDANEESMFRIASTSKIFVSLAILHLQEKGILSIKDQVRDLIPEIEFTNPWEDSHPVLIEHLLEHTTGWDEVHLAENLANGEGITLREALAIHPHSRISRWVPGTRMSYINSGPAVAAYIVEKVTGKTYEDYIRENFFVPMGMETATFFQSDEYKKKGVTLYHEQNPIDGYIHFIFRPSGTMNASPKDMAKVVEFFLRRGTINSTRLISETSIKQMETPSTTLGAKAGLKYGYGSGLYTSDHNGFTYYKHGGSTEGGRSDFSYLPEFGMGYSVQINSGNRQAIYRISTLIRTFQTKDLHRPKPVHTSKPSGIIFPDDGFYQQINSRNDLPIRLPALSADQFWTEGDTLYNRYPAFIGRTDRFIPVDDSLYRSLIISKTNLALVNDPLAGDVLEIAGSEHGTLTLGRVNGAYLLIKSIILLLWILFMLNAFLWLPFWSYHYWKGKITSGANIQVRLWPVLGGVAFICTLLLMIISESLAGSGVISFFLMISTIPFLAASIYSVIVVFRCRNERIKRSVYVPAAILSVLHVVVAINLFRHELSELIMLS